ncbi:lipopolysaccharide biosynthesis protein [Pseudonocardia oroxyli]|uniref:Membrane protein involved in the export of O-antigen and teichoic acid n=1 Tax=Pseudonocardia oroxyli TaxID=366584 RepID=A0A1G7ZDT6_PSEOR|nr:lipopolysaccharide biosynthesis protein [Pseudonocardia oroxyli]SDH06260.1 Membrane protein involved in the export of O-antigen and teichoic acid [Pseudonocardia oroxyli]
MAEDRSRSAGTPVADSDVDAGAAAARTGGQAVWNYVVFALSKGSTLIMTVVLARLLTPADFGVFALALLVINLFDYVKDLGVGASLVQSSRRWSALAPSGASLTIVTSVVVGTVVALTASRAAEFLGNAALAPMIQVLAIALVISALATVPQSRLRRQIDFRKRLLPEFAGAVAKTALSIGLAVGGVGVWSLVFGQLAAATVTTVMYWWVAREPLRLGFDRETAKELVRFGVPLTAVTLLAYGIYNVDYLSIGQRLGDEQLGLYTLAYRLPELLVLNLCVVVSDVLFSSLSRMQSDREGLGRHYLAAVGVVVALTAPLGALMAAAAPSVIHVLYGDGYSGAADDLAVLALFTVVYSASFHSGDVYKAMGRPGVLTAINAGKLVVMAYPIWWAAGHSTLAVALTLLAVEGVHFVVRMVVVTRIIDLRLPGLLLAIARPVLAAGIAGAAMAGVAAVLPLSPGFPALLVIGLVGLVVYLPAVRLTAPALARRATALVRSRLPRRAGPPAASTRTSERTTVSTKSSASRRTARIALLGALGLVLGLAGAYFYTSGPQTYRAHAVLAMLPGPSVSTTEQAGVWEVLSRGQATRTGAIVLNQPQWLDRAADRVGVAPRSLTLAAGAVPDTTLIDVTLDAATPDVAERALTAVLLEASGPAAEVSGPFALDVIQPAAGTAEPLAASPTPTFLGLGLGGALVGVGLGFLLERVLRRRAARKATEPVEEPSLESSVGVHDHAPLPAPAAAAPAPVAPPVLGRVPVPSIWPPDEAAAPHGAGLFQAVDVHSPTVPVAAIRRPRPATAEEARGRDADIAQKIGGVEPPAADGAAEVRDPAEDPTEATPDSATSASDDSSTDRSGDSPADESDESEQADVDSDTVIVRVNGRTPERTG